MMIIMNYFLSQQAMERARQDIETSIIFLSVFSYKPPSFSPHHEIESNIILLLIRANSTLFVPFKPICRRAHSSYNRIVSIQALDQNNCDGQSIVEAIQRFVAPRFPSGTVKRVVPRDRTSFSIGFSSNWIKLAARSQTPRTQQSRPHVQVGNLISPSRLPIKE